jgi:hypothetical protein
MNGPFGPFRAIRIVLGVNPGRRCALPWAMLCKPVGLPEHSPEVFRPKQRVDAFRPKQRVDAFRPKRRVDSFRPEWGSNIVAQGRAQRRHVAKRRPG